MGIKENSIPRDSKRKKQSQITNRDIHIWTSAHRKEWEGFVRKQTASKQSA